MRRIKKFLAVTLSAAMVLSVSVPAMAEGTEVVQAFPGFVKAYEEAVAKQEAAQEAYDKAVFDLEAANAAYDLLARQGAHGVTEADVNAAKAAAENAVIELYGPNGAYADYNAALIEQSLAGANLEVKEEALKEAKDALTAANAAFAGVKDLCDENGEILEAVAKEKTDAEIEEIETKWATLKAAVDKANGNLGTAQEARRTAKQRVENADAAVVATKALYDDALIDVKGLQALATAASILHGEDVELEEALAEAEAEIAACKKVVADKLKDLNAAKAETQKAAAKLDDNGRAVSEARYNLAAFEEAEAAKAEQEAADAVADAKAAKSAIEKQIKALQDDIDAYEAALADLDAKALATGEAAVALIEAEMEYAIASEEADRAAVMAGLQEDRIEGAMLAIIRARLEQAAGRLYPGQNYFENYKDWEAVIENLEDYLDRMTGTDREALEHAVMFTEFDESVAEANAETAEGKWLEAQLAWEIARDELPALQAKANAAKKALYVLVGGNVNPVVDENGDYIYADKDGYELAEDKAPVKLVTYGGNKVVGRNENGEIYCLAYEFKDGKLVLNEDGTPKLTGEDVKTPLSLYAQLEDAERAILVAEYNYGVAKKAHDDAKDALDKAIEVYEYYHGCKPGETTPEQQAADDAQKAAEKAIVDKFRDVVAGEWYVKHITAVYNSDIMKGMSETIFGVGAPLQRQDFALMLYRMAKATYKGKSGFVDDLGDYYSDAIAWAAKEGIVTGYADTGYTVFGVGDDITREQFVVMLYRYFKVPDSDASLEGFADAAKVSGWAVPAMRWAVEIGAIQGKTAADGSKLIDPQAKITREEAAKIIDVCFN